MYQIIKDFTALGCMDGEAGTSWVCDMTFSAKFSALAVSVIPSYQFTYLGYACQECLFVCLFYKLKYLLTGKKQTHPDQLFPSPGNRARLWIK